MNIFAWSGYLTVKSLFFMTDAKSYFRHFFITIPHWLGVYAQSWLPL